MNARDARRQTIKGRDDQDTLLFENALSLIRYATGIGAYTTAVPASHLNDRVASQLRDLGYQVYFRRRLVFDWKISWDKEIR
jgi:hypothetical protein